MVRPQEKPLTAKVVPPVLNDPNSRPPMTATGEDWVTRVPSPRPPSPFEPQQWAVFEVVTPQVWTPPALTDANARPPRTSDGVVSNEEPVPREPPPQQYATSAVVTPQVIGLSPALTELKACPPTTSVGVVLSNKELVPSPICPNELRPQQYATLPIVTPQVCPSPALTEPKVCPPTTSVGVNLPTWVPSPSWAVLVAAPAVDVAGGGCDGAGIFLARANRGVRDSGRAQHRHRHRAIGACSVSQLALKVSPPTVKGSCGGYATGVLFARAHGREGQPAGHERGVRQCSPTRSRAQYPVPNNTHRLPP